MTKQPKIYPFLISFEGIDGSGKTTLINYIKKNKLTEFRSALDSFFFSGIEVDGNIKNGDIKFFNFYTSNFARKLFKFMLSYKKKRKLNKKLEVMLFMTALGSLYLDKIKNLNNTSFVILDRFIISTAVYSAIKFFKQIKDRSELNLKYKDWCFFVYSVWNKIFDHIFPALNIFIVCDPYLASSRKPNDIWLTSSSIQTGFSNVEEYLNELQNIYIQESRHILERVELFPTSSILISSNSDDVEETYKSLIRILSSKDQFKKSVKQNQFIRGVGIWEDYNV